MTRRPDNPRGRLEDRINVHDADEMTSLRAECFYTDPFVVNLPTGPRH
jgi:hypothetical protein